ncbi:MAG: DNA-directed RNA polymerase subunit omega [Armatimonadota bacterium]|nr:DNA-directed RNA polymerase subunit omega [Armatimonadota bacterium]
MALYPEGDKLDKYASRYVLTNLAAKRAKQIKDGAPPLVVTTSTHPLTIALEEIADGAIQAIFREGEIEISPQDTLQSMDLLAQEAGTLDAGFADIGAVFGTGMDEADVGATSSNGFHDEAISLDELMEEENAQEDEADEPDTLAIIASIADLEDDDEGEDEE